MNWTTKPSFVRPGWTRHGYKAAPSITDELAYIYEKDGRYVGSLAYSDLSEKEYASLQEAKATLEALIALKGLV